MLILGLIGLGIGLIGTGIQAAGVARENKQQQAELRIKAKQQKDMANLYGAQMETTQNQMTALQQTTAIQSTQLAQQGSAAVGSAKAGAAIGNVGGASVEKRIGSIQNKVAQQQKLMGIEADIRKQGLEDTMQGQGLNQKFALQSAKMMTEEADWIKKWGWLNVVGVAASGTADAIGGYVGMGGIPGKPPKPSGPVSGVYNGINIEY